MAIATEEFISQIDQMTVLELNGLVKALEEHYGVSAAAAAVAMPAGGAAAAAAPVEEKTEFDVVLKARGDEPRPEGGQGPRRVRACHRQGGSLQGRGRVDQEEVRRGRRHDRDQVNAERTPPRLPIRGVSRPERSLERE